MAVKPKKLLETMDSLSKEHSLAKCPSPAKVDYPYVFKNIFNYSRFNSVQNFLSFNKFDFSMILNAFLSLIL